MKQFAIIFDLDGVLVDTFDLHFHAWQQIAQDLGVQFDRLDMDRFRGRRRYDCLLDLLGEHRLSEPEIQALLERKDHLFLAELDTIEPDKVILPGAFEFVDAALSKKIPLGVASSSTNAKLLLEKTGLMTYMQAVADGSTVKRSKPAPDIFVWVAGALRARPKDVIVFEDSEVGITAAHTAGMIVVGVGDDAATMQPDMAVPNMRNLNFDDLISLIS